MYLELLRYYGNDRMISSLHVRMYSRERHELTHATEITAILCKTFVAKQGVCGRYLMPMPLLT